MTKLTEKTGVIDEASNLAVLKLLIFEAAVAYLKGREIEPMTDTLRDITQRVSLESLSKLRDAVLDKSSFEAQTKRIVADVLYEYGKSTNTQV